MWNSKVVIFWATLVASVLMAIYEVIYIFSHTP